MPNALSFTPPPAPNPQPQQQGQPAARFNPAPSHEQSVAALRHFQMVGDELYSLLKNPDLGKADIKSAVIDATTKLVAKRVIPASQAVTLLGQFPDRPFEQKQWLERQYAQNMASQIAVLNHHRQNSVGSGDLATEMAQHSDTSDQHIDVMNGMARSRYGMK